MYYPSDHPTLGNYGTNSPLAPGEIKGIVFPEGTRSVLFFGARGAGTWCYGQGTLNKALDRQPNPGAGPNEMWCYDPEAPNDKGGRLSYRGVWAYDAHDLAKVKLVHVGLESSVRYVAVTFPYPVVKTRIFGAAYLRLRGYLSRALGEGILSVIHVYK